MRIISLLPFAIIFSAMVLALAGLSGLDSKQGIDLSLLQSAYFQQILGFSIYQALLSSILSLILGYLLARALYYVPSLYAKKYFLALCLLCFVFPTLVLITTLALLLGHNGSIIILLNQLLDIPVEWNLYGLNGILIAHVFLNTPLVIRVIYSQLQHIPEHAFILARQIKLSPLRRFLYVEWPFTRASLSGLFILIFSLCFNSFAIVLALGGGPQSTTLEVAIYQALKYDFNMSEAITLAWVQFGIIGLLFFALNFLRNFSWLNIARPENNHLPALNLPSRFFYILLYVLSILFFLSPLYVVFYKALSLLNEIHWQHLWTISIFTTLVLGFVSSIISMVLCYMIIQAIRNNKKNQRSKGYLQWLANLPLMTPAMVLAVGIYVFHIKYLQQIDGSMLSVILINSILIIPLIIQQWQPRLEQFDQQYHRLAQSMKLSTWQYFKLEWKWSKSVRIKTFSLALLLTMGDVAVIAILGQDQWPTLPILIYQYASNYQLDKAAILSAILLILYLAILLLLQRQTDHD